MLKSICLLIIAFFFTSCAKKAEDSHNSLTNSEIIHLIHLYNQAENLPKGQEKLAIAEQIHELTGSEMFIIGEDVYGFGEPHRYISQEKEDCTLEIVTFARENSYIVTEEDISENCQQYLAEVKRKYFK